VKIRKTPISRSDTGLNRPDTPREHLFIAPLRHRTTIAATGLAPNPIRCDLGSARRGSVAREWTSATWEWER